MSDDKWATAFAWTGPYTPQPRSKNRRAYIVGPEVLCCILSGTYEVLAGPPPDATFLSVSFDASYDAFLVVVAHESFEPVAPGEKCEAWPIDIRRKGDEPRRAIQLS